MTDVKELGREVRDGIMQRQIEALRAELAQAQGENTRLVQERDDAQEKAASLERQLQCAETHVAAARALNTPLVARVAALEKLLSKGMEWLEHLAPSAPNHHCGPEGNCDGGCVDYMRHWEFLDEIRAAIPPESSPPPASDNAPFRQPLEWSHLDIVFDGPPGRESGRFVECEDAAGRSVKAGEWIERRDGMWALRIARLGREP